MLVIGSFLTATANGSREELIDGELVAEESARDARGRTSRLIDQKGRYGARLDERRRRRWRPLCILLFLLSTTFLPCSPLGGGRRGVEACARDALQVAGEHVQPHVAHEHVQHVNRGEVGRELDEHVLDLVHDQVVHGRVLVASAQMRLAQQEAFAQLAHVGEQRPRALGDRCCLVFVFVLEEEEEEAAAACEQVLVESVREQVDELVLAGRAQLQLLVVLVLVVVIDDNATRQVHEQVGVDERALLVAKRRRVHASALGRHEVLAHRGPRQRRVALVRRRLWLLLLLLLLLLGSRRKQLVAVFVVVAVLSLLPHPECTDADLTVVVLLLVLLVDYVLLLLLLLHTAVQVHGEEGGLEQAPPQRPVRARVQRVQVLVAMRR